MANIARGAAVLALLALLAGWTAQPAFADRFVIRGGEAGGDEVSGMAGGYDYVREGDGRRPLLISWDGVLDVGAVLGLIFGEDEEESFGFEALVVSWPVRGSSALFLGAGLAFGERINGDKFTLPALRFTATTPLKYLLVAQVHLTAAPSPVGGVADFCLGFAF